MLDQQRNILPSIDQFRHVDQNHAQPVVQVLAEISLRNLLDQVFVGRRKDPRIHVDILVGSDACDLPLLQRPQYLGLRRQTHIADLVQKDRPAVRLFEFSLALFDRRSKRPFLMPEEFALDQFRRNRRTVHLDERHVHPVALFVQPPGHQLLPRTVRPRDQDPRIGRGHFVDQGLHPLNGRRLAHDFRHVMYLASQGLDLLDLRPALQRVFDRHQHPVHIDRFFDIVERPFLDTLHRRVDISVSGDHHDRLIRMGLDQLVEQFDAVHLGHLDVGNHQFERFVAHHLISGRSVFGRFHRMSLHLQQLADDVADAPFVIDNQDFSHMQTFFFEFPKLSIIFALFSFPRGNKFPTDSPCFSGDGIALFSTHMNREKSRLLLSEYGRNVQRMVAYLKTIEDRELRNRQAEVVVAVMGNVNPAQRDSEGFQHMLWDHLFMIADFDLDVDAPYPKPTPAMFAPHPKRMSSSQSYIAQKQYGANVRRMAVEPQSEERDAAAASVAKYMKQKSFEYNKEFPSNEGVIGDIRLMSRGRIVLESDTLDHTRIDTSSVRSASGNRMNKTNRNSGTNTPGTISAGTGTGNNTGNGAAAPRKYVRRNPGTGGNNTGGTNNRA